MRIKVLFSLDPELIAEFRKIKQRSKIVNNLIKNYLESNKPVHPTA